MLSASTRAAGQQKSQSSVPGRGAIQKAKLIRAERGPAYLPNKPAGLIGTAGGVWVVNAMDYIARALHGCSVPLVVPVAQSW